MMMMMMQLTGHHHQSQQSAPSSGYNVYMLYQKEVYNTDHAYIQSMLDWLYTSVDSPYKFIIRNKCQVHLEPGAAATTTHKNAMSTQQSIRILNLSSASGTATCSCNCSPDGSGCTCGPGGSWQAIEFNLKYLKEIYVDRRHKDTCVLVSRSPTSTPSISSYVWKRCNPSNYQSFRTPYSLNHSVKKAYLLTILKFKEGGPSKLLSFIQSLDSLLLASAAPAAASADRASGMSAASSSFKNAVYGGSMTSLSSATAVNAAATSVCSQQQQQQQPQQQNVMSSGTARNVNVYSGGNASSANVTASAFKHRPSLQEYYR